MNAFNFSGFGSQSECLRRYTETARGPAQIEPWFDPVRRWAEDRDFVIRPERGDPPAGPAIAAGHQPVPVEDAGDQIIIGDEHQLPNRRDDIGGDAVALPSASLRQAQFSMDAANPMDQENNLGGCIIDIGDHLVDDSAHDALLEPGIRRGRRPDNPQVTDERGDIHCRQRGWFRRRGITLGDVTLDVADARERPVLSRLQFSRDQQVLRIGGIILPECLIGTIARSFEIAHQRIANLITARACNGDDFLKSDGGERRGFKRR